MSGFSRRQCATVTPALPGLTSGGEHHINGASAHPRLDVLAHAAISVFLDDTEAFVQQHQLDSHNDACLRRDLLDVITCNVVASDSMTAPELHSILKPCDFGGSLSTTLLEKML